MSGPKRLDLGRFVRQGRQQAQRLKNRAVLSAANSSTGIEDVRLMLDDAQKHLDLRTLRDREWVLMTIRGVLGVLKVLDDPRGDELRTEAESIGTEAVAREELEFAPLRAEVKAGRYDVERWRAEVADMTPFDRDAFTSRLFGLYNPPLASSKRGREMVHFVASNVDDVLEVAEFIREDDVFYDVGAGTGKVALLVRWLTGATVVGVEFDPIYVAEANAAKDTLGLDVRFEVADARAVDYDDATALFLFEPFRGSMMASFLARLEPVRHQRQLRVFSRFAVEDGLADVPWLDPVATHESGLVRYLSIT